MKIKGFWLNTNNLLGFILRKLFKHQSSIQELLERIEKMEKMLKTNNDFSEVNDTFYQEQEEAFIKELSSEINDQYYIDAEKQYQFIHQLPSKTSTWNWLSAKIKAQKITSE